MRIIKWKDVENENVELSGTATYNGNEIATRENISDLEITLNTQLATKQDALTAGDGITITDNIISAQEIEIAASDKVLTLDTAGLKANLSLVAEGSDAVLYGKDNTELGRINISSEAISSGYYDSTTKEIVLVLTTGSEIRVPADDLISEYTASGYIDIDTSNNITLDYDLLSDQLINDDFVKGDVYTKTESDSNYLQLIGGSMAGSILMNNNPLYISSSEGGNKLEFDSNFVNLLSDSSSGGINIATSGQNSDISISSVRNVSIDTTLATYNGSEIFTVAGGTLQGDLTINGNASVNGYIEATDSRVLTTEDNIDTLFVSGKYRWNYSIDTNYPQGTFPTDGYNGETSSSVMEVSIYNPNSVYQLLYNNGRMWFRRTSSTTVYDWYRIATHTALESYLPLAGGTLTGNVVLDSNTLYLGTVGNGAYLNYDNATTTLHSAATYGVTISTSGSNRNIHINPTGSALYNGNEIATVNDIPTNVSQLTNDAGYITDADLPDVSGYLPLTGGTLTGDLTVEGGIYGAGSFEWSTPNYDAFVISDNQIALSCSSIIISANDRDVELWTGGGIASYNGKEIATVDANKLYSCDLSTTSADFSFNFGIITTRIRRLSNGFEIIMSASSDITIYTNSIFFINQGIEMYSNSLALSETTVSTFAPLAPISEAWVRHEDQLYHITVGANTDFSDVWIKVITSSQ